MIVADRVGGEQRRWYREASVASSFVFFKGRKEWFFKVAWGTVVAKDVLEHVCGQYVGVLGVSGE